MLDKYCAKLAKDWEIENGFGTNVSNIFVIPYGEDLEIVLAQVEEGFTLTAVLGPCPTAKKEDFYTKLLAANTLGQFTKGSVLALDEKENIVATQAVTFVSQYRDFYEILEDFMGNLDTWKQVIKMEAAT